MRTIDGALLGQVRLSIQSDIDYTSQVILDGLIGSDDMSGFGVRYLKLVGKLEALRQMLVLLDEVEHGALAKDDE